MPYCLESDVRLVTTQALQHVKVETEPTCVAPDNLHQAAEPTAAPSSALSRTDGGCK
ncbi:hypothetical protein AURDEDRAFT_166969 [Auricularia subglabra TFB-10046 SS5]|nr:hypothetical protein AURDEDRAFT_166969 [Auricularia subglabra TFB-10046 SS5]